MRDWIGIFAGVAISIIGWIYSIGKKDEQLEAMKEKQSEQSLEIAKLTTALGVHEMNDHRHFQDTELHWTSRERDELSRTLQALQDGQSNLQRGVSALLDRAEQRRKSDRQ